MRLVTVATHESGYFKWLKQSCDIFGYNLDILGFGEKWLGFNWKLQKILQHIQQIPDNEIICVIDAFDIVMLRDASEMETMFKIIQEREKCKMIIANEVHDNMTSKITGIWYFGLCKNENLNAGSYIAYVKDLKSILYSIQKINSKKNADDQMLLSKVCRINPSDIYIDVKQELFLATVSDDDIQDIKGISIIGNQLYYNSRRPFLLHGVYNSDFSNIIEKLGYSITEYDKASLKNNHSISKFKKLFYYAFQPKNIVIALVFIIILSIYTICTYKYRII